MTSGFFNGDLLRGLAFRVLFFLSLALLPIGLIAISQTQQIAEQDRTNAELSLIALTEQASIAEAEILQQASAAADALASIVRLHADDTAACKEFFRAYQNENPQYSLVGFIPLSGVMVCSSAEGRYDFSENASFAAAMERPMRRVETLSFGSVTRQPVTVVTAPVLHEGDLFGFISISIPAASFKRIKEPDLVMRPIALMTFNANGDVVTSERGFEKVADELPADVALGVFAGRESTVFAATNAAGQARVYAVRNIIKDTVSAVSVWSPDTAVLNPPIVSRLGALVPIIMWAASLIVAFWALNRLAIRHIRKLVRQMRRFGLNRSVPSETLDTSVPTELIEMETAFINMAESILQDEARLEDSLREKNILLKEVHHRVKNNLQLISSIMNMQIRQAKSEDARFVLKRLQERILSLATVHKNLYQNDDLVRVDAEPLLTEVINQLLAVGIAADSKVKVKTVLEPVSLDADDAAPLTLLVSEALTNALKHVPHDRKEGAEILISLTHHDEGHARFALTNTIGGNPPAEGTGLGSRLIHAFSRQLNGQSEVTETEDTYTLEIVFPVPQTPKQVYDY